MRNTDDNAVLTACSSGSLVLSLLSLFIGIGAVRIALKLCRGQQTNYGHLFSGGDCFLQVLGWGFLVLIPLLISVLLLVIPFFILISIFWPSYYLIVDRKTGVFDSFPLAMKMGMPNMGSGIVLMLASIGIVIGGLVALGIGIIFAGAYLMVLWATAYLMMTGEVS